MNVPERMPSGQAAPEQAADPDRVRFGCVSDRRIGTHNDDVFRPKSLGRPGEGTALVANAPS
jgi:hypothetical protein